MFEPSQPVVYSQPPALIAESHVFDEQQAKREWDEACADEQDATERKAEILQRALKRWPRVKNTGRGRFFHPTIYSSEMRRFVRDVLGMPDSKDGGISSYATKLIKYGAEGKRQRCRIDRQRYGVGRKQARILRQAVVELTTKYRLGADPSECMEALDAKYKELTDVKA